MLDKSFSVLFFLKASRNPKDEKKYIYIRITVDSRKTEISTKILWDKSKWNPHAGRATGKMEESRKVNELLDSYHLKILKAKSNLLNADKEVTAEAIKGLLVGSTNNKKTILRIFQNHNDQLEALVGKEYAPGTLERYRTSIEHTRAFIKWKYKKDDLEISKLDYDFIADYDFWLKSVRGCAHNTTVKYLGNFKKIVLSCVKRGWLSKDPFLGFKMVKKEVNREFLTENELNKIAEKSFGIERLEMVRDIFLFCCYTGLAYIDVKNLKKENLAEGIDGEKWIFIKRQKTETPSRIPLLPQALDIVLKYENNQTCEIDGAVLPVLSNQKMNSYLKEIADLCGIKKELTFHIARHTFATTVTLSNGVPLETVSKLLGHKSLKQTQHYAKILDRKISDDMLALKKKISRKN